MTCSKICQTPPALPIKTMMNTPPWQRFLLSMPSNQPYSPPHHCPRLEVPRKPEQEDGAYSELPVTLKEPSCHHPLIVMTAPRPANLSLPTTLSSLERAGLNRWPGPKILVSDGYIPPVPPGWSNLQASTQMPSQGSAKTFNAMLREAIKCDPELEYLTYFQDDVALAKNALDYIARVSFPPEITLISWFNSAWIKPGWTNTSPSLGCRPTRYFIRSQAMTLTRASVDAMLYCPMITNWPLMNSCDAFPYWALGDLPYADHYPSLAQHTEGLNSACNLTLLQRNLDSSYPHKGPRTSPSFVGEEFDALGLIPAP